MSIKSDLTVLKTNIQAAKDKLYTNLTEKGVTDITTASTLDAMADSVSDIKSGGEGGNSFSVIGYPETPSYMQDGIDYSQTIYDNWDASVTNRQRAFSGDTQLLYFPLVDTSNVTDMNSMFIYCSKLQYVPSINTSNVTNMSQMFHNCYNLTSIDLSSFDTSKVTDMSNMFYECGKLTSLDLTHFDTSNVTDMQYMFYNCYNLTSLDLSNWNLNGTATYNGVYSSFYKMFERCTKLTSLNVSGWNTSKVTEMGYMFEGCSGLTSLDVSSFDTSNVTNMVNMFDGCRNLTSLDLSSFDTSKVTNMSSMFYNCSGLTSLDVSSFDTSNVTNMVNMFYNCYKLSRIDGSLDWSKISSYPSSFITSSSSYGYPLRYMTIKNLGTTGTTFNFNNSNLQNWGDNTDAIPDARQSLVDTFVTHTYDRASNGLSTCTIQLYSTIKARLTEDEIAQITAKGFTIA